MSIIANMVAIDSDTAAKIKIRGFDVPTWLYESGIEDSSITLDKAWQTIHYALTGEEWGYNDPLSNSIFGGIEIGDDVGYGSCRMLEPEDVKDTAKALNEFSDDKFVAAVKAVKKGTDIYSFNWNDVDGEIVYSLGYFQVLKKFYNDASAQSLYVVHFVN